MVGGHSPVSCEATSAAVVQSAALRFGNTKLATGLMYTSPAATDPKPHPTGAPIINPQQSIWIIRLVHGSSCAPHVQAAESWYPGAQPPRTENPQSLGGLQLLHVSAASPKAIPHTLDKNS